MFQSLYPRQMISQSHGLDLVWEIQLIIDDLVDQELIGNRGIYSKGVLFSMKKKLKVFRLLMIFSIFQK